MPIATAIDHLILSVNNLEAATTTFRESLGLHVSGGGIHPSAGTMNRIIVLGDDYIELIAAQPGVPPKSWLAMQVARGREGWIGYALATADPQAAAATLRERQVPVDGPLPGRLEAEPGYSRDWRTVRFIAPDDTGLPFLIRHEQAGEERRRLLAGPVGLAPHPIGVTGIASITVAVADLEAGIAAYARCFDLQPGERGVEPMLGADTVTLSLPTATTIVLAAPQQPESGPIARQVQEYGEGLFAVTLAVDDLDAAVKTLRGRGIGVRVEEPEGILVAAQLHHQQLHGGRIALVSA